jgi:hypothetical protein
MPGCGILRHLQLLAGGMKISSRVRPKPARRKRTGLPPGDWASGEAAGGEHGGVSMGEEGPQAVGTQPEPLGDREGGSHCHAEQIDRTSAS